MMKQPDEFKWNLVIFEPYAKHCYLEGCYDDYETARKKGMKMCGRCGVRDYRVYSETEYIKFKNPYE